MVHRYRSLHRFGATAAVLCMAITIAGVAACSLTLELGECDDDRDCPDGLVCTDDGLCDGADECDGDDDCSDDSECVDGTCKTAVGDECEEDEECPEGEICRNGNCLDGSAQCDGDDECIELFDDDDASCNDGICSGDTELIGGPCQEVYGAADEEDPFLIGVIMQFSGVGGGFGRPMLDAIRIAKRDINQVGGIDGQPIALIACDTEAVDQRARDGAEHLVDDVGVEAILGFNSSQVLDITPDVTIPEEVLLMSPSATASTISGLNDDDLVWRTAPSDEGQATALSLLLEVILEDHLPEQGIDEPKLSILVRNQDQWSEGLRDHLSTQISSDIVGDSDRFSIHSFPNVGAGDPADYSEVAAEVAAEDPHPDAIVVLGSADSWQVIENIDSVLEHEPLFLGADAMKNAEEAADAPTELEGRIWGTGPRNVAEIDYQPYTIFRLKFEQEMNDDADNYQFVANAFDALYTVAFGAAAEGTTGPEIAEGLGRLDDGPDIFPSTSDAADALETLADGGTVNYEGASGPINFDEHGDPESMPIALWCFEDATVPERGTLYSVTDDVFTPLTCASDDANDDDNDD